MTALSFRNISLAAAAAALLSLSCSAQAQAQNAPSAPAAPPAPTAAATVAPDKPHGFPPVVEANFKAATPDRKTVDEFIRHQFGFDSNRTWQVQAVLPTLAPGITDVTVLVASRTAPDQIQTLRFLVTSDGKYAILGTQIVPFGSDPFASTRDELKAAADGPAMGSDKRDLMLVEFSDLECPHCKAAEPTMTKLIHDYPNARVVYENFPLASIHPWATTAALYAVCVNEQSTAKFFPFLDAVFAAQEQTDEKNVDTRMKEAATKAGADAEKAAVCSASPAAAAKVAASVALAEKLGVESTPTLFVNGRAIPIGPNMAYETLQQIIAYQAKLDGITMPPSLTSLPK